VLTKVLGYSEKQIMDLYQNNIVYHEPAVEKLH